MPGSLHLCQHLMLPVVRLWQPDGWNTGFPFHFVLLPQFPDVASLLKSVLPTGISLSVNCLLIAAGMFLIRPLVLFFFSMRRYSLHIMHLTLYLPGIIHTFLNLFAMKSTQFPVSLNPLWKQAGGLPNVPECGTFCILSDIQLALSRSLSLALSPPSPTSFSLILWIMWEPLSIFCVTSMKLCSLTNWATQCHENFIFKSRFIKSKIWTL